MAVRHMPRREFRIMGEFMERVEKARADAREAVKYGYPSTGRARPKPGDTILGERPEDKW